LKRYLFLVLFMLYAAGGFLPGCGKPGEVAMPQTMTETVKLFYGDAGNEKIVAEERLISYQQGEDRYTAILQELIKGPEDKNHRANISPETKIYGTIQQDSALIVDFTREFNRFAGSMAEIIGVGSIVNTLTQFGEIEQVKILVEGEELIAPSGMPRGFMEPFPSTAKPPEEKAAVTLYFSNRDGTNVVGETRVIAFPSEITRHDYIKLVLQELIKGPRNANLKITIPPEAKVQEVRLQEDIACVDFSEEMQSKHWGGATGEALTINSIVNTLTEYPYIQRVKMTVEGEPLNIEHAILEEPIGRNEGMIPNPNLN
jgi:germination protein M